MQKILDRLPVLQSIFSVYGVIVFFTYGWSMLLFSWVLPSWLKYLTLNEIGIMFMYQLWVNLIESLAFLVFLLILSIVLPARWLREQFSLVAGLFAIVSLGLLAFLNYQLIQNSWLLYSLGGLVLFFSLMKLSVRFPLLKKGIENFLDRMSIFIYIFVPLGLVAGVMVLLRKI